MLTSNHLMCFTAFKETAMDRSLARIILVDSYMPGRATEVAVSGHTSINGRNGAGRTLELVPVERLP